MSHPDYPESEKLAAVASKSQVVGEFVEWCGAEKGLMLSGYVKYDDIRDEMLAPTSTPIETLLAEFFEIDLKVVEAERRQMLESLR